MTADAVLYRQSRAVVGQITVGSVTPHTHTEELHLH